MPTPREANVSKYLQSYAEAEISAVKPLFCGKQHITSATPNYHCALMIPCFDEQPDFFFRLMTRNDIRNILVIIVINQADGSATNNNNVHLFNEIRKHAQTHSTQDNLHFFTLDPFDVLVVDRFSPGQQIPIKQGVGLARKIGGDIATACFALELLQTPWLYSTDADAHLPRNYFSQCDLDTTHNVAQVFSFSHHNNHSPIALATKHYEQAIKYYRDGLAWAKSPYAFYTLGSTLAISICAYTQVRGFPKRAGGEDFYVLNKLAKLGNIQYLPNICIELDARISQRVPFGTGPAVQTLMENSNEMHYYNPDVFNELKTWLQWSTHMLPHLCLNDDIDALQWQHTAPISEDTKTALDALGFDNFLSHATEQCATSKSFIKHFHTWFDAFRTLKFVRHLSEHSFPQRPLSECLYASKRWKTELNLDPTPSN